MKNSILNFVFCLFSALVAISCTDVLKPDEMIIFQEVSPMPVAVASAACAVVDDVAYVYGGRTNAGYTGAMYSYTPATDTWVELPSPPLEKRTNALAVSYGEYMFIGLGYTNRGVFNPDGCPRDWWRFKPSTGEWTRMADYPSNKTVSASAFVHDHGIYVCFGYGDAGFYEYVYRYDIASDTWDLLDTNSVGGMAETVAGEVGGRYYAGTVLYWYEFILEESRWERRKSGRANQDLVCSTLFAYGDKLYLVGGREWSTIPADNRVFRYDPVEDKWAVAGYLPEEAGKENMISFVIDGVAYAGLGEYKNKISSTLYKLRIE